MSKQKNYKLYMTTSKGEIFLGHFPGTQEKAIAKAYQKNYNFWKDEIPEFVSFEIAKPLIHCVL